MTIVAGGARGVSIPQGLEFDLFSGRLNGLGPVDFSVGDETEDSVVTLHEQAGDLSWHLVFTLPPDAAVLRVEGRVFNRTWAPIAYNAGFTVHGSGLAQVTPAGTWTGTSRFEEPSRELMPHQLDVWGVQFVPFSGSTICTAASEGGVLSLEEGFRFQATRHIKGKVFIQLEGGQTLEAPIDILPEVPFVSDMPGRVTAVAIRDEQGDTIFSWLGSSASELKPEPSNGPSLATQAESLFTGKDVTFALNHAEFDLRLRAPAKTLKAIAAMRENDFLEASRHLDEALLSNAEDHIVWLLKAMIARKSGEETDDLLNAHFLAPLEPLLRMESFLAQNLHTKEKSSLVTPLAENPDALVEGACFLYDLGQYDDLSRWADECLRHREVPMLRYLLADALLSNSPMSVDAASNISKAAATPVNPPYPWRATEKRVLTRLCERFPTDDRIRDLLALMNARAQI